MDAPIGLLELIIPVSSCLIGPPVARLADVIILMLNRAFCGAKTAALQANGPLASVNRTDTWRAARLAKPWRHTSLAPALPLVTG